MAKSKLRIVFFGSSAYCLPILETLYRFFNLAFVVTGPDRLIGRKKILTPTAVKVWAKTHGIDVLHLGLSPLKNDFFSGFDLGVVSDFGQILKEEVFDAPKYKTINIHHSLLPCLRGPSPVQTAILEGLAKTGTSIFILEKKVDTGPILFQEKVAVGPSETAPRLYEWLFALAAGALPEVINGYVNGKIKPQPQNHNLATYCHLLDRNSGFVKWEDFLAALKNDKVLALKIERTVRAFTPWPGVWTLIEVQGSRFPAERDPAKGGDKVQGSRLKIIEAKINENGLLLPQTVQLEGKKSVPWSQLLLWAKTPFF
ncbi:MAG: methionyl-tRNA formyltransferase [bacterium]|nr:methionyl-tRNA formyltransferase [bacterium]